MNTTANRKFVFPQSMDNFAEFERMAKEGIAVVPPIDFVAKFVQLQRAMLGWKQDALASFAGVSLSTIQRIERGEAARPESLGQVAVVLGQRHDAFTRPRIPLSAAEVQRRLSDTAKCFENTKWVSVRPLQTQPQVAALARTEFYLIDDGRLGGACRDAISCLTETIDSLAYFLELPRSEEPVKRRHLYAMILDQVRSIERDENAIALAGTYQADTGTQFMPTANVALIGFFPKASDPGAIKRRIVLAPAKIDLPGTWDRFCRADESS